MTTTADQIRFAAAHVAPVPTDPQAIPTAVGPSDPADLAELAFRMADDAIARFNEARRFAKVAEAIDSGPGRNVFASLANSFAVTATAQLISVIRASDPQATDYDVHQAERKRWEARAILSEGRLYVALPNPDDDGDSDVHEGYWRMRLAVLEIANVHDLGSQS